VKISVQCFTLRKEFEKDVKASFARLRDIGFRFVELAGLYGRSAGEIRSILDKSGLKISGSHVGLDRLENDLEGLAEECRILGTKDVIVPWVGEDRYKDGWDRFAQSLTPYLDKLDEKGLRFSYHNHAFEFAYQGDRPGLDVFFDAADPRLKAQLDLYWCHRGGQDPAAFVRKLKGRIVSVHLKDGHGTDLPHVPPGQGVLDWDAILAACEFSGVEVGTIEYDECEGSPFEAVAESLAFFRSKGLGE
jgi:sugar phosphate isomerase/epimerase